jgi:hypothetical protein
MKLIFACFLFAFQFFTAICWAQYGCTDPQAQNFDPAASWNDGSCIYTTTNYTLQVITDLSDELQETSGLIFCNNNLLNINDGGNSTEIQELDTQGNILRTIHVSGSQNIDWEAICQNDSTIFLGDFGNNGGNRQDLCIYRISKNQLIGNDTVGMSKFWFTYPDQSSYANTSNNHNFDCEAFVYSNDSLHLFTKGWQNLYTKHYVLPINSVDTVEAVLKDSLWVDGLITDATIDSATGRILLVGYKNNGSNFYTSFVYLLFDYPATDFFSGNKRRIEIGNMLTVSQTEGISLQSASEGFISSEKITSSIITIPPKLFSFNFSGYFENSQSLIDPLEIQTIELHPNPANQQITLPWEYKNLVFLDNKGAEIVRIKSSNESQTLDLTSLPLVPSSLYFIRNEDTKKTVKFIYQ